MKVLLTGAHGMLGTSIRESWDTVRSGDELIGVSRSDVDLRDQDAVRSLLRWHEPDAIIHAAAKVGGIADKLAHPTAYLLDNMRIDAAVVGGALELGIAELLYVGSAAVYPAETAQPIAEDAILEGPFEPANEPYAVAKLAGMKLCEYASRELGLAYRVALPSNLYGIHDRFDLGSAHLVAAALAKVDAARIAGLDSVDVWGDGTARREFTFAGDLADWLVGEVGQLESWPLRLNLGAGSDHSIAEFYDLAADIVGFSGRLVFDPSRPAGVPRRLLDSSIARQLGWAPRTAIRDGMHAVYTHYLSRREGI